MAKEKAQYEMDNFDTKNLKSIEKFIDEPIPKMVGMFVDESGKTDVKISEESRKIAAKSLLE